ncbi:MAG: hypothetical protein AAB336_12160 [Acidobacteriota bacterium]
MLSEVKMNNNHVLKFVESNLFEFSGNAIRLINEHYSDFFDVPKRGRFANRALILKSSYEWRLDVGEEGNPVLVLMTNIDDRLFMSFLGLIQTATDRVLSLKYEYKGLEVNQSIVQSAFTFQDDGEVLLAFCKLETSFEKSNNALIDWLEEI